jgi:hypothetical protein
MIVNIGIPSVFLQKNISEHGDRPFATKIAQLFCRYNLYEGVFQQSSEGVYLDMSPALRWDVIRIIDIQERGTKMYLISMLRRIIHYPGKLWKWITQGKQADYTAIVEQIAKDYLLTNDDNLKSEKGKTAQNFIGRGLFNTTACGGEQLGVYFRHLDALVDHLIAQLADKFRSISLITFKDSSLRVIDREYDNLSPIVSGLLLQSQLLQPDVVKSFENGILREKTKAKQRLENQCAISEQNRVVSEKHRERWYQSRTIQAALIGAAATFVLTLFLTWLIKKF